MDLLSEIIESASWKTSLLWRRAFYKPWGFLFPCVKSGGFHIITQGSCYLHLKGKEEKLAKGDVLFISRGQKHALASSPKMKLTNLHCDLTEEEVNDETKIPLTTILSVRYEAPDGPMHPFFLELPECILIKMEEVPGHHPLQKTVELISIEMDRQPRSDLILQRLSDILLYYVIKRWMEVHNNQSPGWIRAFHDDKIKSALEAIHKNPSNPWTLHQLASSIGLSRASLASRFREVLGFTPMDYVTRVRMEKARSMMRNQTTNLEEVARNIGYANAFAFSRAYKRTMGVSPSRDRIPE